MESNELSARQHPVTQMPRTVKAYCSDLCSCDFLLYLGDSTGTGVAILTDQKRTIQRRSADCWVSLSEAVIVNWLLLMNSDLGEIWFEAKTIT